MAMCTIYWEYFMSLNFFENGNFKSFTKVSLQMTNMDKKKDVAW